ncbi:uncharacterized protein LOC129289233 [Prosopis cineraria]|uniref:uncharacterized protein LOC129289233 n=1 Tax=Prosopis cineraria TaxID=364024 RepID=UPI00240F9027|nr:uncharacterized protein LOC129289233 [Prosopis cineraria]
MSHKLEKGFDLFWCRIVLNAFPNVIILLGGTCKNKIIEHCFHFLPSLHRHELSLYFSSIFLASSHHCASSHHSSFFRQCPLQSPSLQLCFYRRCIGNVRFLPLSPSPISLRLCGQWRCVLCALSLHLFILSQRGVAVSTARGKKVKRRGK